MNTKICKDCVHSFVKGKSDGHYRCRQTDTEVRVLESCPLGYSDEDMKWIESKELEDKQRGCILYAL